MPDKFEPTGPWQEAQQELQRLRRRVQELEAQTALLDPVLVALARDCPDNIMLLDREMRIQFINYTVPDLTVDEVLGTSAYSYLPEEYRSEFHRCYERVATTRRSERFDTAYVSDEGDVSFWESRVGPIVRDDRVVGFVAMSSDVTERRQAAADRDRFFNLSSDMLCVATSERFKRINPAFERTLGYAQEELLSTPFLDFVHPEDRRGTLEAIERLEAGEDVIDYENRYLCKDGTYRWLSWRATAERHVDQFYAVARDVTERKKLEAQLLRSQKLEGLGQLAGGIAHDFNNIVLALLVNADFAAEGLEPEDPRLQNIEEIRIGARRAADLTRQLLTFARRQPFHPGPLDFLQVTAELVRMLERTIPEHITIEFTSGARPLCIEADRAQIDQVILNLCLNARDAMPEGGRLQIALDEQVLDEPFCRIHPWACPGQYARLRVADDGGGIEPRVMERLFEPFFTTKQDRGGTGLGLATAYGIVKQHGGLVHVESEPGQGTCFDVYLPLAGAAAPGEAMDGPLDPPRGGSETILVVEDEHIVRNVVVRLLQSAGYRVLAAADGAEALELVSQRNDIALALLDVVMPKLSGPEVLTRIRAMRPGMPAILSTGYSDEATLRTAEVGVPIIPKPYPPETLLRAIRHALDETKEG